MFVSSRLFSATTDRGPLVHSALCHTLTSRPGHGIRHASAVDGVPVVLEQLRKGFLGC